MVTRAATRELEAVPAGSPWSLLFFLAVGAFAVAMLGVDNAVSLAVILVNVIFIIYLMRHMAFASASRWVVVDLHQAADLENDFRPTVSVLVACHNEELVAHSLVRNLPLPPMCVPWAGASPVTRKLPRAQPFTPGPHRPPHSAGPAAVGRRGWQVGRPERRTGPRHRRVIVVFDADHARARPVRRLARHFRDPEVGAGRCVVRNPDDSALARAVSRITLRLPGQRVRQQALFSFPHTAVPTASFAPRPSDAWAAETRQRHRGHRPHAAGGPDRQRVPTT
jgi:hypothetical protein